MILCIGYFFYDIRTRMQPNLITGSSCINFKVYAARTDAYLFMYTQVNMIQNVKIIDFWDLPLSMNLKFGAVRTLKNLYKQNNNCSYKILCQTARRSLLETWSIFSIFVSKILKLLHNLSNKPLHYAFSESMPLH